MPLPLLDDGEVRNSGALFSVQGFLEVNTGSNNSAGRTWHAGPDVAFSAISKSRGNRRRTIIVDTNDGHPTVELQAAKHGDITRTLGQDDAWSFLLDQDDPKLAALVPPSQPLAQVQLWRGDRVLTWGPLTRPGTDGQNAVHNGKGPLWPLQRRTIGRVPRKNYLKNGDFEDWTEWWGAGYNRVVAAWFGGQALPPLVETANQWPGPVLTGRRSMLLQNFALGADAFVAQAFYWTVDVNASPLGDIWTFTAWVYVPSEWYSGPAYEGGRGLYLERFSTTELDPRPEVQAITPGAPLSLEHVFVPIDDSTPKDIWTPMVVSSQQLPNGGVPEIIQVRLYAPFGIAFWDHAALTRSEGLQYHNVDQAKIAQGIVLHAQDPSMGKSDLGLFVDCPDTGIVRDRFYMFADRGNAATALGEFPTLADGFDFDVAYTPWSRTFRTYYPAKINRHSNYVLELGGDLAGFSWLLDGESGANVIIVQDTDNSGITDESTSVNPWAYAGGLTLEEVLGAPAGTPISQLQEVGDAELARVQMPEVLAMTTKPDSRLADFLDTGDAFPVNLHRGALSIVGWYHVVQFTLHDDDSIDLVGNRL